MAIEHSEERDMHRRNMLIITKTRGQLTVEEIEEYLSRRRELCNRFWMLLIVGREDGGRTGWDSGQDPKGNVAVLYEYADAENCPLCGEQVNYGDDYEEKLKALNDMNSRGGQF